MPRVGYNERKKQVLELLTRGPTTVSGVARELGIKESAARHHLIRYWRYRLVSRTGGGINPGRGSRPFIYHITPFGFSKIKSLKIKKLK